eukprot:COSAG01_NODE_7538_length_3159_cov_25.291830_3_plen_102_part_00
MSQDKAAATVRSQGQHTNLTVPSGNCRLRRARGSPRSCPAVVSMVIRAEVPRNHTTDCMTPMCSTKTGHNPHLQPTWGGVEVNSCYAALAIAKSGDAQARY